MQNVTLKNDYHNTEVTIRCEVLSHIYGEVTITPTVRQIERARKELCGSLNCECGGIRGPQDHNGKRLVVDYSKFYTAV